MRRRSAAALVAGCGLAASCVSGAPAPAAPPAVEAAEVLQYRRDAALGVLQVRVVPQRDAALSRVVLRSPRFPAARAREEPSRLAAGRPVALPLPHGEPDCGVPAGAPAQAALVVDGAEVALPVDPEVLDRVADRLCAAQALAERVRLSVDVTSTEGPVATADLVVTRGTGDGPLTVPGFGGHVLLAVEEQGPLPVLPPGTGTARTPLALRAARCDPHALAESKQTGTLRVFVVVGDGEPQQVLVRLGPDDARALESWVVRTCRSSPGPASRDVPPDAPEPGTSR